MKSVLFAHGIIWMKRVMIQQLRLDGAVKAYCRSVTM